MPSSYKIPRLKKGQKPRKSITEMMKDPEKYLIKDKNNIKEIKEYGL